MKEKKNTILKNKGGSTFKTTYTLVFLDKDGEESRKTFRTKKQAETYLEK